jgi:transposase
MSNELRGLATQLVVRTNPLRVNAVRVSRDRVRIAMSFVTIGARCPHCHQVSRRVHSRYTRQPIDLTWGGLLTQIELHVRRFHCDVLGCAQRIFSEQLPSFVQRYARRTEQLNDQLLLLTYVTGGAAGSHVASRFKIPISADSLLRLVRRGGRLVDQPTPRVLGVDDWAKRKGRSYGTILCDLERHQVIDLLDDREATTLQTWLEAHPGIEVICRDRAGQYAEGARLGAPNAIQVADRFHLLMNLTDTVKRVAERQRAQLQVNVVKPIKIETESNAGASRRRTHYHLKLPRQNRFLQRREQRQQRWLDRQREVQVLKAQGLSQRQIQTQLKMSRGTLKRYLSHDTLPEHALRNATIKPYTSYLEERWQAGVHNATQLFNDIVARGYRGSYLLVSRFIQPWRNALSQSVSANHTPPASTVTNPPVMETPSALPATLTVREVCTPRQVAFWVTRDPDKLKPDQKDKLEQLLANVPELLSARALAQDFRQLLMQHQPDQFDGWLARASQSLLTEFQGFAQGLIRDKDAVAAAIATTFSNGQTEGHVNRLKTIKRQMFGRGKLDLLRKRIMRPALCA